MRVLILNTTQPKGLERMWGDEEVINSVSNALQSCDLETRVVSVHSKKDVDKALREVNPDITFPNGYWLMGEQSLSYLTSALEEISVPYIGSPSIALNHLISKSGTKELLSAGNIPTPRSTLLKPGYDREIEEITFPSVVKVNNGAESVGMEKVENWNQLDAVLQKLFQTYEQPVLVEEWCRTREYTTAILGNGNNTHVMPIEVSIPKGYDFFDSTAKAKHVSQSVKELPDSPLKEAVSDLAARTYQAVYTQDWARMDILENDQGSLFVIDINVFPGLRRSADHPSFFPFCAEKNLGLTYDQTIIALVYEATNRLGMNPTAKMVDMLPPHYSEGRL